MKILIYRLSAFAYILGIAPTACPSGNGTRNPKKKLWRMLFGAIRGDAELEGRIVKD